MTERISEAVWKGSLKDGKGSVKLGSGAYEGPYSFSSRFESGTGTNPEELIGAAHAGCYSMAMSGALDKEGFKAEHIHTVAKVKLEIIEGKATISHIHLDTEASIPGISAEKFAQIAEDVKLNCPVSVALSHVPMSLSAKLL